ncbi:MAG: glycosyltransferase [Gammaproteobacteria bacterium]|nr:glycosyltransferase [Gammaproteobacteria bacterium]
MNTVIQVVQHLRPGGIETMALDLASFCDRNERNLIISLEGDSESAITAWPRLEPHADRLTFLGKKPGLKPVLILDLIRLFRSLQVDVVHTHHIGPLLYAGLAARLARVRCLIHTEHDAWHLNDSRRRSLQRWVIHLARPLLIADAETVATRMSEHLARDDIRIIRNGIDTDRFKPGDQSSARHRLGLPRDVRLIGCSGRLEIEKGQRVLVDALALLPKDVNLALAGTGSTEEALRHQVRALGLTDRVHFLGRIDEMPTFYQALDIFCLPSFKEGMPLSPLEAQACDVPAAVTNVGGSRETLCPNTGQFMPKDDVEAMASTLHKMFQQPCDISPRGFVQQRCDVRLTSRAYAALRYTGG